MPLVGDVYQRGDFFQQIAGAHKPNIDDMLSTRGYFGLDLNLYAIYGNLKTDDGQMYEVLRNFNPDLGNKNGEKAYMGLTIQSTEVDGQNLIFDQNLIKGSASAEGAVGVKEGNEAVWRKADGVEGNDFEMRVSEDHYSWNEGNLFSIDGPLLGPGLHWYLPARDGGIYYVSHMFSVSGTFNGHKATGFIAFDQIYLQPGATLYVDDPMMKNFGHLVWYTWGNTYKDGSYEAGHFIMGHDRLGFAVITDGKNVRATQDISGKVIPHSLDDSPFSAGIELTIDGQKWHFTPDPRGKMPTMLQKYPPTPQQEGVWQREGETRELASHWAWGETETKYGFEPQSKLPTHRQKDKI